MNTLCQDTSQNKSSLIKTSVFHKPKKIIFLKKIIFNRNCHFSQILLIQAILKSHDAIQK